MNKPPREFAYVDHWLAYVGGHQTRMATIFLASRPAALAYGENTCTLDHPRIRRVFTRPAKPELHRLPAQPDAGAGAIRRVIHALRCLRVLLRTNIKYFRELRGVPTDPEVAWFCPNTTEFNLPGLLIFALFSPQQRIVGYIQNPPSRYFRLCGGLLRLGARNVRFVAEEEAMSERAARFLRVPVTTLLYPLLEPVYFATAVAVRERSAALRIALLGLPRREKGYQYLPAILAELGPELAQGMVGFVVQTRAHEIEIDGLQAEDAVVRATPGVEIISEALGPQEYLRALQEADVILTPYLRDAYGARLSWIAVEGMALAKPVIITEGTLAASWLVRYGAGLLVREGDTAQMAATIRELLAEPERYDRAAAAAGKRFRADNHPDRFFSRLAELWN